MNNYKSTDLADICKGRIKTLSDNNNKDILEIMLEFVPAYIKFAKKELYRKNKNLELHQLQYDNLMLHEIYNTVNHTIDVMERMYKIKYK